MKPSKLMRKHWIYLQNPTTWLGSTKKLRFSKFAFAAIPSFSLKFFFGGGGGGGDWLMVSPTNEIHQVENEYENYYCQVLHATDLRTRTREWEDDDISSRYTQVCDWEWERMMTKWKQSEKFPGSRMGELLAIAFCWKGNPCSRFLHWDATRFHLDSLLETGLWSGGFWPAMNGFSGPREHHSHQGGPT